MRQQYDEGGVVFTGLLIEGYVQQSKDDTQETTMKNRQLK